MWYIMFKKLHAQSEFFANVIQYFLGWKRCPMTGGGDFGLFPIGSIKNFCLGILGWWKIVLASTYSIFKKWKEIPYVLHGDVVY